MKTHLLTSALALTSLLTGSVLAADAPLPPAHAMSAEASGPNATVERLVAALNHGDLDTAVSLYEPQAQFVVAPGQTVVGREAIKAALGGMLGLKPKLTTANYRIVQTGDTALYISDWSMAGTTPDGHPVNVGGLSADVLRKQPDGSWLIAIDNPHGAKVLAAPAAATDHP